VFLSTQKLLPNPGIFLVAVSSSPPPMFAAPASLVRSVWEVRRKAQAWREVVRDFIIEVNGGSSSRPWFHDTRDDKLSNADHSRQVILCFICFRDLICDNGDL
jgi:hypothetical protein